MREAYARSEHGIVTFALQDILDSVRKIRAQRDIPRPRRVDYNGDKPVESSEPSGRRCPSCGLAY